MPDYSVILVDDEPWALGGLINAYDWKNNGFAVLMSTTDPFEAHRGIVERKPDLALIDIKMRGMDGLSLIQKSKIEHNQTLFIIVTAYDDFKIAKKAISLGVFEYILKPIDKMEMFAALERAREYLDARSAPSLPPAPEGEAGMSAYDFDDILEYINKNYAQDLRLSELAERFFFHQTYICDLFRKRLEMTFTEYLNEVRIKQAYRLIINEGCGYTKAATLVGYNSYSYFSKLFKLRFGVTPSRLGKD